MDDNCEEKKFYDNLRDIMLKNTGIPKEYLDVDITDYVAGRLLARLISVKKRQNECND